MGREIKFRAWDKRLTFMSAVSIIEFDKMNPAEPIYIRGRIINKIEPHLLERGLYQEWQTGGATATLEAVRVEDVVLMQFTGLTDKNGKEIWEGDILSHHGESGVSLISWQKESMAFVFCKQGWMHNHFIEEMSPIEEYEVLGNIYENPSLLEEK